jgi:predicted O-methyltransferase YrrM
MHLPWRDLAPGKGPAINTSLTEAETVELKRLAKDGDVLEIGSAYGYSTVALALVANSVVAVDPHIDHGSYGALNANLGAYGLDHKVFIMKARSQDVLPSLVGEQDQFDLVWVDGDHTSGGVTFDVEHALGLLRPGGVLACHDYAETCCCPDVGPTLRHLLGEPDELVDTLAVYRR